MSVTDIPEIAGLEEVLRSAYLPMGGKLVPAYNALDDAIKRCVAVTNQVKRQSVITLEIKISGEGQNTIPITTKLKVKEPEPAATPSLFYADSQGRLHTDDPNQGKLPLDMEKRKRG